MIALDTIEVSVEHGGEVLTLDVEITAWPTRATLEHPGDPAEWRVSNPDAFWAHMRCYPLAHGYVTGCIDDQVQEHCAGQAAPGRGR